MTLVIAIAGIVLKLVGVAFLFAAALGLLRFKDVLQRMHAATKAGTIGAGLVILGSLASVPDLETIIIGLLAIVFLLFTAPVAGHLLGRAAYVSGAPLQGLDPEGALVGVLSRKMAPAQGDHASNTPVISADEPLPFRPVDAARSITPRTKV